MNQSLPAVRSFDALARELLDKTDWPNDIAVQPRSLATLLGKLDREQNLEWLAARPEVQRGLSRALGTELVEIQRVLRDPNQQADEPARRVRLQDLADARPLDLLSEPLFPGVPQRPLHPAEWRRVWWIAPNGAGRSLSGRWLEARGLATFVRGRNWDDLRTRLPIRGAVFVELESPSGEPADAMMDCERLCVAAPFPPPASFASEFESVRSPVAADYLDDLVGWVGARLPADGRFDGELTLRWLRAKMPESGFVDSVGTALGLCGAIDLIGSRRLQSKSLAWLAQQFFAQRVASIDPAGAWLKQRGLGLIVAIFRHLLTDSETSWDTARSIDEWLERMVPEVGESLDSDWIKLALAETTLRGVEVERAARRLPPAPYRALRALEGAAFLQPTRDAGALRFGPRWFGRFVFGEALEQLVSGSPLDFGEALLRPQAAPAVLGALHTRLCQDADPIEQLVDIEPDDSPAYVAAIQGAFVGAGLALLEGAELPSETLEWIWDEQLRHCVVLADGLVRPLIELKGEARSEPRLELGAWYLAALCVSEQLPASAGTHHDLLRPWILSETPQALERIYDAIFRTLQNLDPSAGFAVRAFELIDRIRRTLGSVHPQSEPHILERPGVVLDEADHQVLDWKTLSGLRESRLCAAALHRIARQRKLDWSNIAGAFWQAWHDASEPPLDDAWFAIAESPEAPDSGASLSETSLWAYVPPQYLRVLLEKQSNVLVQAFGDSQWQAIVEAARTQTWARVPVLWAHIPHAALLTAMDSNVLNLLPQESLVALYQKYPEELMAAAERLTTSNLSGAVRLLAAAPEQHALQAIARLRKLRLLDLDDTTLESVRSYLYGLSSRRVPGWRDAFALLVSIERSLRPTSRFEGRP